MPIGDLLIPVGHVSARTKIHDPNCLRVLRPYAPYDDMVLDLGVREADLVSSVWFHKMFVLKWKEVCWVHQADLERLVSIAS